jgi:hypothetical protein
MTSDTEHSLSLTRAIGDRYGPIDPAGHANYTWSAFADFGFARAFTTAPIVLAELHQVACAMPILFESSPQGPVPAAVLQMGSDAPHLVTDTGAWGGFYIPGSLRMYPFAANPAGNDNAGDDANGDDTAPAALMDTQSPLISTDLDGTRFFDALGAPTPQWQSHLDILQNYRTLQRNTQIAGNALLKGHLLVPARSLATFDDPLFEGLLCIDRTALSQLPVHRQTKLLQTGAMELAHAHFTSRETLQQNKRLHAAQQGHAQMHNAASTATPTTGTDDFLSAMATEYEQSGSTNLSFDTGGDR